MSTYVRFLLHGGAATFMNWGYKSLPGLGIDAFIRSQYGGHAQFLTIQGLALAWITMVLSLAQDSFPSSGFVKKLKRYLMIIAMPLSVVISSIYWTLIIAFPSLILQASGGAEPTSSPETPNLYRIPLSTDICLHALPAISMIVDFFCFEKKYSKQEAQIAVPVAAGLYAVGYGLWVEHCASHNDGVYPYPFLTDNTLRGRLGIYVGATAIAVVSFKALNALHR